MQHQIRIARPVRNLERTIIMYCYGLALCEIGRFENHDGFDGVMLGGSGAHYHFEFTHCRTRPVVPSPTHEDLIIFYISDAKEWQDVCDRMIASGFDVIQSVLGNTRSHFRRCRWLSSGDTKLRVEQSHQQVD